MTITNYNIQRIENITEVTVTSSLSGTIYFHWWLDGIYQGMTESATRGFFLPVGEQARVEVIDSNSAAFDPVASAPAAYPPRRSLFWIRSLAADVLRYRIEQQKDGGGWTTLGYVDHLPAGWSYSHLTDRLTDLSTYAWRIVPVDAAGNDGTSLSLGSEKIVRTPDAPGFAIAFDEGTTKVTFSAA